MGLNYIPGPNLPVISTLTLTTKILRDDYDYGITSKTTATTKSHLGGFQIQIGISKNCLIFQRILLFWTKHDL